MSNSPVTNINITFNVALVTIDNLPNNSMLISDIFNTIANNKINIDMISQAPPFRGNISISFSVPSDNVVTILSALNKFKKAIKDFQVEIDSDNTKLQVYGEGMRNIPGVAARLFTILANEDVEIKLITTSEVDISYLINKKDVNKAINAIKKEYNLD